MKFSICVPNYNYGRFIERTLRSVLEQKGVDLELSVSDNASTDDSVAVVRSISDPRLKLQVNACNVGFAGNLDRTVQMGDGEVVMVLPSDDLLRPGALASYAGLFRAIGGPAFVGSTVDSIDTADAITGRVGPDRRLWTESDRAPELDEAAGGPVYRVKAETLLSRCLSTMTNPYGMQTVAYPRWAYARVGGYGGGRIMNPDKWLHWRILGVVDHAYFVDRHLGAIRWHPNNQTAQQKASGALKYLVDEYATTFEMDAALLERVGMKRTDLEARFVEYDIARHGLAVLGTGDRDKAARIVSFGMAAYPGHIRRNQKVWALRVLLAAGPVGQAVSKLAYKAYSARGGRALG